ncbi:MAG TPA: hypothetical protein VEI57_14315 [Nitrospirota bacterium]|nr:hypothetical protein [Nitrospirota bacterium]
MPPRSVAAAGARIVATTFQSLPAKNVAVAMPMPDEHPPMSTVFFILLHSFRSTQVMKSPPSTGDLRYHRDMLKE